MHGFCPQDTISSFCQAHNVLVDPLFFYENSFYFAKPVVGLGGLARFSLISIRELSFRVCYAYAPN